MHPAQRFFTCADNFKPRQAAFPTELGTSVLLLAALPQLPGLCMVKQCMRAERAFTELYTVKHTLQTAACCRMRHAYLLQRHVALCHQMLQQRL